MKVVVVGVACAAIASLIALFAYNQFLKPSAEIGLDLSHPITWTRSAANLEPSDGQAESGESASTMAAGNTGLLQGFAQSSEQGCEQAGGKAKSCRCVVTHLMPRVRPQDVWDQGAVPGDQLTTAMQQYVAQARHECGLQ
jgi:hypothetical protein